MVEGYCRVAPVGRRQKVIGRNYQGSQVSTDHAKLDALLKRAKVLRKLLKDETNPNVGKKSLRDEAAALGSTWHKDFAPTLKAFLPPESLEVYNTQFTRL